MFAISISEIFWHAIHWSNFTSPAAASYAFDQKDGAAGQVDMACWWLSMFLCLVSWAKHFQQQQPLAVTNRWGTASNWPSQEERQAGTSGASCPLFGSDIDSFKKIQNMLGGQHQIPFQDEKTCGYFCPFATRFCAVKRLASPTTEKCWAGESLKT